MSIDTERRARELVTAATDGIEPTPELDERIRRIAATPSRRPHRLIAVGTFVVLVLAAAAIAWIGVIDDASQDVTPAEHAPTTSGAPFPRDRWTPLTAPAVPLSGRAAVGVPGGAVFWEMSDPDGSTDDKYARLWHLDLSTGDWTVAAPPGLAEAPRTVRWGVGDTVWVDDRIIAVMVPSPTNEGRVGQGLEAVSWTPGEPDLEGVASFTMPVDLSGARPYAIRLVATDDGAAALVSYQTSTGATRQLVWSYDLDADSWTRLPDPPTTSDRVFSIDWTGEEIVVLAGRPTPMATYYDGVQLLRFRPGDAAWSEASRPPDALGLSGQAADAAWDGERLVVVTYAPSAAAWDPAGDAWTPLSVPPFEGAEDYPRVLRGPGDSVVAELGIDQARLDHGSSTWSPLPGSDVTITAMSGDSLIGMGPVLGAGQTGTSDPQAQTLWAIGF